jgi:hypothetical protein
MWRPIENIKRPLFAVTILACWQITPADAVSFRVVAKTGDIAISAPAGRTFNTFSGPTINNSGQVAFFTSFAGGAGGSGVYSEGGGALHLVARNGMVAPGTDPSTGFSGFTTGDLLIVNEAGDVAFRASLFGANITSANNFGIWSTGGGSLHLVARTGSPAPGATSGANFSAINTPVLNDAGETAFSGEFAASGLTGNNNSGIWKENSGVAVPVAIAGTPQPGAAGDETFSSFSSPLLNSAGQLAFRAALHGTNVDGPNDYTIWKGTPGSLQLVARDGSPIPGSGPEAKYYTVEPPTFNQVGEVAFHASLTGSAVNQLNDEGIWSDTAGTLHEVIREGNPLLAGGNSGTYLSQPAINKSGTIAFIDTPVSVSPSRLWSTEGGLHVVASEQVPAPGSPGDKFGIFHFPSLNAAAHVAFEVDLNVFLIAGKDAGIWINGPGGLEKIIKTGEQLEVAPGVFKTIDNLFFGSGTGNENGQASGFNDHGQIAFRAHFDDSTWAVVVADVNAVPEPASAVLMFGGAIAVITFARRSRCPPGKTKKPGNVL